MRHLAIAAIVLALVAVASQARAQNLVQNPGFEVGTAPWVQNGVNIGTSLPRSGTSAAEIGCAAAGCTDPNTGARITQDVPTTPGVTYTLTFWYAGGGAGNPNREVQAFVSNGAPTGGVFGTCTGSCVFQTQALTTTHAQASVNFTATSAVTRLTFTGRNQPSTTYIDDVSIVVAAAPAAVPTLSEWAMILLGLTLAGGAALHLQRRLRTA